jgi:hypothetical protein
MENGLHKQFHRLEPKIHGLAVGMTLGLGTLYFNKGCAVSGLCPSCGACALQLPIFLLPLLADGGIMLAHKALSVRKRSKLANDTLSSPKTT